MLAYKEFGTIYEIAYDPYDDGAYTSSLVVNATKKGGTGGFQKSIKELRNDAIDGQIELIITSPTEEEKTILRFMIVKTFEGNWWGSEAENFFKG